MKEKVLYKQVSLDILLRERQKHTLSYSLSYSLSLSLSRYFSHNAKSCEIRRWTLCSRLFLFRLASSPRRRLFWRWTRPPPPWPWPSSPPAWVLSRWNLRRRSSSIGPRRTFWTFPNHLWEGRRSCRQICLKRIEQKRARQSEYKRVKNTTALKKNEIFFPLFSLLLLQKCLLFFVLFAPCDGCWRVLFWSKNVFTLIGQLSTRVISLFHSFQLYLVAKDTILYLLSLFDERREQKKLSRRMVFVVERNEDVVLLRARAPESIRAFNGKNDVYRKEEIKKEQNGWSIQHTQKTL